MTKYPVLQSGFISYTDEFLTKPDQSPPTFADSILLKEYKKKSNNYFFSKTVTSLYDSWRNDPTIIKQFDFRENILSTVFTSFGTDSVYKWLRLQDEQETITELHRQFINETFIYAIVGNRRSIESVQWIRLLGTTSNISALLATTTHFKPVVMDVYELCESSNTFTFATLLEKWLCRENGRENGFVDLLVTLYVIFGIRENFINNSAISDK